MKHYSIPATCLRKHRNIGIHDHYAQLLYNVLLIPELHTYLEIGCGEGVSTSACVAALAERGDDFQPMLCDVAFTPRLLEVAPHIPRTKARSLELLAASEPGKWDCVFVDGNHEANNVAAEIELLRRLEVPTVIAHDTAHHRILGPAQIIDAYADWPSIHDTRWLGMFLTSRDERIFEALQAVYADFRIWSEDNA